MGISFLDLWDYLGITYRFPRFLYRFFGAIGS
jgi:hypothetical protein